MTYLCLSVGVRLLVIEYSRGIIASEGYDRVRRLVKSCVSDTSEPSE